MELEPDAVAGVDVGPVDPFVLAGPGQAERGVEAGVVSGESREHIGEPRDQRSEGDAQLGELIEDADVPGSVGVVVGGDAVLEYDVAIIERYAGQAPVSSPDLQDTPVGQDRMLVAVPAGSPGTTLEDFADTPWTMEPPGSPVHAWALATCRGAGFQPRIAHDTADVVVQCALAAAGHAAAFLPALTPPALRGPVRLVPLPAAQARTLSVATRRSRAADPAIRAVTAAIRTAAGGLLEGVPA